MLIIIIKRQVETLKRMKDREEKIPIFHPQIKLLLTNE